MTAHVTGDGRDPPAERPRTTPSPEQDINPLQRLIRQRLGERGWSYGEVARRGSLPRSTVYTLATTRNLTRPPRPDTIDALATGLDVPVAVVRAAAAESAGLHYYDQAPAERERGPCISTVPCRVPGGMRDQDIPELIRSRIRLPSSASGCRSHRPVLGMKPRTLRPSWPRRRNSRPVSHAPASAGHGRKVADPSGASRPRRRA